MKNNTLRLLTSCLLLLCTTVLLRADRDADRRQEKIPSGHKIHPPPHKIRQPAHKIRQPRTGLTVPFETFSAPSGYSPQQLRHAYGFDQLSTTGEGQTIAIIVAYGSPTVQADLDTFCAAFSIPSTTVEVYYPQGQPMADSDWASETALDVQWAHAIAPGARIVVVAAKSPFTTDLLSAVDYAVNLGAKQISMSWGAAEFSTETTVDYHFNVPGVTFVAASGDSGSGVSFPASSPYVVSVGGTSLSLDSSANVTLETTWSGSGGGISAFQPIPNYQSGWLGGTQRGVPDVAYDADPNTGVPVYQTATGWQQFGGTSMGAPQWAALVALANSLRTQSIPSAPDALYALANANYAGYFRDIISGSNGNPVGPGYDLATGLGAPLANQLVLGLAEGFSTQVAAPVFFPPAGAYSNAQNVTIVSATPGAFISYTADGTIPNSSTSGTVYSGPIVVGSNSTLNAMAYLSGFTDSLVTSSTYTFAPQTFAPTFSPGGGTYTSAQSVTIASPTYGATIIYTVDGSTPTPANGVVYTNPVDITQSTTLQAIAYEAGFTSSPITSANYTLNLPPAEAPAFSPAAGTYTSAQAVTISSASPGATIRYTNDGSTPSETNGIPYGSPIYLSQPTTLRAIAYGNGFSDSPVTNASYTINLPSAAAPVFSLMSGSYANAQSVTITSETSGATIIYTTDGSTPVETNGTVKAGIIYSGPVNISNTTLLKAIAFGNDFGDSPVTSAVYAITSSPNSLLNVLRDFTSANNGGIRPVSALIQNSDGDFYGTTSQGGSSRLGTVFKMNPTGALTTLFEFNGFNGSYPGSALVRASDGDFYSTTGFGGTNDSGTIFKMTPAGAVSTLAEFNRPLNGSGLSGLIQASDGNFYGTTQAGGVTDDGTVFKVTPAGAVTTLASFNYASGLYHPIAGLVQGTDGDFYSTIGGGNVGAVYKMTPAGIVSALVYFNGANGSYPGATLLQGSDGNFYGTTENGGSVGYGTIFRMTPAGDLTTLVSFDGTEGRAPTAVLVQASDGNFYGTTAEGGRDGFGTVFKMTPAGALTTLHSFNGANGALPFAGLIEGSDGNLYGTTAMGGVSMDGVIFQLILPPPPQPPLPTAASPTFDVGSGTYDVNQLIAISSATLGATIRFTTDGSTPTETNGTIYSSPVGITGTTMLKAIAYKIGFNESPVTTGLYTITSSPAASLNVLHDFSAANNGGISPSSSLVLGSDGNFYGTTSSGGSAYVGTVFQLTPSGILTTVVSFNYDNGAYPRGLTLGTDGNFYGTTYGGGLDSLGSVFKLTPAGVLTPLISFNGDNGNGPSSLTLGSDGNFYGTTEGGGSSSQGTVFKLTPSGVLSTLASFNGTNGNSPSGAVVRTSDGNLYGTTYSGGSDDTGTVFKLTPSGVLSTLISFNTTNGSNPLGGLLRASDGNFYGTTSSGGSGGSGGAGTAFRLTPAGVLTTLASFDGSNGAYPYGGLIQGSDGNLYGATTGGGSAGYGTLFKLTPAGLLTTLVDFDGANGTGSDKALLQGSDGNLYGTTTGGGVFDTGVIFQLILPPPQVQVAAPVINPGSGTYFSVQSVTITSATADATIRYTTDNSTPTETYGTVYSGAFNISNPTTLRAIAYKTGVANSAATTAILTVKAAPVIMTQPLSQTVVKGATVTFGVIVSGSTPLSYQWKFKGNTINGATSSTYVIPSAQTSHAGNYVVVVSNWRGRVTSAVATLTVNVPPTITLQPASQTIKSGAKVTFTTTATGTAPLGYQWRFNGSPINGATASSYSIAAVQPANAGDYTVTISNVAGSVTSSAATLTVTVPPTITTQPVAQTVTKGKKVTFKVVATGTAPLSYQWRFNGNAISGATASTYVINSAQSANAGNYTVVVTNVAGSATSSIAKLTVK